MARMFLENVQPNDIIIYDKDKDGFVNVNISILNEYITRDYVINLKSMLDEEYYKIGSDNIPFTDNKYQLGSNGRRYAKIYAKTFHGTATSAMTAYSLEKKNAENFDVLTWSDKSNDWIAMPFTATKLKDLTDIDFNNLTDETLLMYNSSRGVFELVSKEYVQGKAENINSIQDIRNFNILPSNGKYQRLTLNKHEKIEIDSKNLTSTEAVEITLLIQSDGSKNLSWPENITWERSIPNRNKGLIIVDLYSFNGGASWGANLRNII